MTTTEERKELLTIAQTLHEQLREMNKAVNTTINKLIEAADELKLASADEIDAGNAVTKRVVTYGKGRPSAVLSAAAALKQVDGEKKQRRKRGPVSPERRAQLTEQLKKARATRRTK